MIPPDAQLPELLTRLVGRWPENAYDATVGDRDLPYFYEHPSTGRYGRFGEHEYCRLLLLRGTVRDSRHQGDGLYADDLRPSSTTVTEVLSVY
jgi:hypothetical protein